jgi:hypothetical protein
MTRPVERVLLRLDGQYGTGAVLADEDQEQDPDRWCSHSPCSQEAWQIVSQWVWNLRLELGQQLEPTAPRTTEFAPPIAPATERAVPTSGYVFPKVALPFKRTASLDETLCFSLMARCAAPLGRPSLRPKSAESVMAACG